MSLPPLIGPPGNCIKARLESAVFMFDNESSLSSWEDLRIYILQDESFTWDKDLTLRWQRDITNYFLELCKVYRDKETVMAFTLALEDGQHFTERTHVSEAADLVVEDSHHGKTTQPKPLDIPKEPRVIFFVRLGDKTCDGAIAEYTNTPMSRLSDRMVGRWNLEGEVYEEPVGVGHRMNVIDMTWEMRTPQGTKSQTTTFEVVDDKSIKSDVEFGRNALEPTLRSRQQTKPPSVTTSLPELGSPIAMKTSGPRSVTSKSAPGGFHRSHSSGSAERDREAFILRQVVAGLSMHAEMQWNAQSSSEVDPDE